MLIIPPGCYKPAAIIMLPIRNCAISRSQTYMENQYSEDAPAMLQDQHPSQATLPGDYALCSDPRVGNAARSTVHGRAAALIASQAAQWLAALGDHIPVAVHLCERPNMKSISLWQFPKTIACDFKICQRRHQPHTLLAPSHRANESAYIDILVSLHNYVSHHKEKQPQKVESLTQPNRQEKDCLPAATKQEHTVNKRRLPGSPRSSK